jgi:hypothetical protein
MTAEGIEMETEEGEKRRDGRAGRLEPSRALCVLLVVLGLRFV